MKKVISIITLVVVAAVFIIIGIARKGSGHNERRIAVIPKGTSSVFWESVHAGAKKEVYSLLEKLAEEGKAILFISSELPAVKPIDYQRRKI